MLVHYNPNGGFGRRLKLQRSLIGISQEKLAEDIGCSTQYIYQIEAGRTKPSIDTLLSLAEYFGVSVDYLLKGSKDVSSAYDTLDSILRDFTPIQRESLANALIMIKYQK